MQGFTDSARAQPASIHRLRNQAERLYDLGRYDEATRYYQQAYQLSRTRQQPELSITLLVDLSSMDYLAGNYQAGISRCLQGLDMLKKTPVADSTAFKVHSSLGELYRQLNDYTSSAHFFEKADRMIEKHPQLNREITDYVIYHYSNQAMLHESAGRFSVSQVLALKALQLARDFHIKSEVAIICNVLAGQYEAVGNFAGALALRREGIRNYSLVDLQLARMYSGIGWNLLSQQHYPAALRYLQMSYRLYTRLTERDSSQNDTRMVVNLYNHLGLCYWEIGREKEAELYLNKAVSTYTLKYGGKGRILATSWLVKGKIKMAQGQPETGMTFWQRALASVLKPSFLLDKLGNPPTDQVLDEKLAVEVLFLKGNQLTRQERWEDALQTYRRAIDVFHQARKHLGVLEDKLYLSETVLPLYQQAQEAAYQLYRQNRTESAFGMAFTLLEQGRATSFQDFYAEATLKPQYLPAEQLRLDQEIRQELSSVRAQLLDNPTPEHQRSLLARERDRLHQHYLLLRQWEQKYPDYYYSKYLTQPVTVQQVQARLPETAAYITYNYSHGKLHAFALTHQRSSWKTIPVDSLTLFRTLDTLRSSLRRHPGISQYTGTPFALQAFEWFIAPLLSEIESKESWVVNTGGVLDGLPIDVFETGRAVNDYIGFQHTIRYVYTATSLGGTSHSPGGISADDVLAIAPFNRDLQPTISDHFGYETLSASGGEFANLSTRQLMSEQATRPNFLNAQKNHSIWFLSTHAHLDSEEPMHSYIAFYPNDTTRKHRLYAHEISQMNLRHVRLVALSACEGGNGKLYRSEGMMSLARAFAYAGCPTTISTLWNAHDRTSAFLVRRTYAYLQEGDSPATALRKARTDFFKLEWSRPYNHPYFWAHFVVIGANEPLYQPGFRWPQPDHWVMTGSCAALLIAGVLLFLRYNSFWR
ncbi:CHAT domain-containing protein [Larkinella terrae]